MFIIKELKRNRLSLPVIIALNVLSTVESIKDKISTKCPSLFTGLHTYHVLIQIHTYLHNYVATKSKCSAICFVYVQKYSSSIMPKGSRKRSHKILREGRGA